MRWQAIRLTAYSHGGGCACKVPPGELEELVARLPAFSGPDLVVGARQGDDAAVVAVGSGNGVVLTVDFFSPVVDDAYDWGRIAAANALSDIYAMGGRPLVALNLLGWPRESLPMELASEVLRGGCEVAESAGCFIGGGHSIDDPEPKYGLAVTGTVVLDQMMTIDAGRAGLPLSLTKPLGIGTLNTRHKETGAVFPQAIAAMATLNDAAATQAVAAGIRCATDVTGFGLLGHLKKLARASQLSAVIDVASVPLLDEAVESVKAGFVSGGTRRNLDWVIADLDVRGFDDSYLLLLADAQTSGGLLIAGEIPGAPVIGELIPRCDTLLVMQ